jgi:hypothetical protein
MPPGQHQRIRQRQQRRDTEATTDAPFTLHTTG